MSRAQRVPFVRFCAEVLHLELTAPWRVLLAVAIDGAQPRDLQGEDREIARSLFGAVEEVDPRLRRILVWRLGRASGKTTLAAALCIWAAWTCDLSRVGPGQLPCAFVVSPSKPVAKIAVGIARELVRASDLEPFVVGVGDTGEGFILRRPDRRKVEIRSVAASRGGANLRGRDVPVLVLDESEFFASNEDGGEGYSVTDSDQIDAVMPRLLGHVVCVSTPWPTANATADYFDRNHGRPTDALAALGPSMFMRPTPQLELDRARELLRDEENALREYDCIPGVRGGSRLFDVESVKAAIDESRPLVVRARPGCAVGAGGDLAFERDSTAVAVAARDPAGLVELLEFEEIRPGRGAPLSPGYVVRERIAPVMRRHGVARLWADAHYRQSAIEHLVAVGLGFTDAPAGNQGKYDVYIHFRSLLRSQQVKLPNAPKLVAQLRAVTATPLPHKGTKITSPRRAGSGHGDIVSAVVLAAWAVKFDASLAAARAKHDRQLDEAGAWLVGISPAKMREREREDLEKDHLRIRDARIAAYARDANGHPRSGLSPADFAAHDELLRRNGSPAWSGHAPAQAEAAKARAEQEARNAALHERAMARLASRKG